MKTWKFNIIMNNIVELCVFTKFLFKMKIMKAMKKK